MLPTRGGGMPCAQWTVAILLTRCETQRGPPPHAPGLAWGAGEGAAGPDRVVREADRNVEVARVDRHPDAVPGLVDDEVRVAQAADAHPGRDPERLAIGDIGRLSIDQELFPVTERHLRLAEPGGDG